MDEKLTTEGNGTQLEHLKGDDVSLEEDRECPKCEEHYQALKKSTNTICPQCRRNERETPIKEEPDITDQKKNQGDIEGRTISLSEVDSITADEYTQIISDRISNHSYFKLKRPLFNPEFLEAIRKHFEKASERLHFGFSQSTSTGAKANGGRGTTNGVSQVDIDAIQKHPWICPLTIKFNNEHMKDMTIVAFLETTRNVATPLFLETDLLGSKWTIRQPKHTLATEMTKIYSFTLRSICSISHDFDEDMIKNMEHAMISHFKIKDETEGI